MNTVLMYNHTNQHIREVTEGEIERLQESGWRRVEKYDLVAIYSPSLNEHKTVLKVEAKHWENMGYFSEPTFVYHPEKDPRVVSGEQAREMFKQGWYDSPAKAATATTTTVAFSGPVGGDPSPAKPQNEGAAIRQGKALADMTKAELAQAYFDTSGQTLDADLTKAQMLAEFEKLNTAINTAA